MNHRAKVVWQRGDAAFIDNRYSRAHRWLFDGGAEIAASSSPHVVKEPMSDSTAVDPEEAFIASLSSCHMLWFLSLACERGLRVDEYVDDAEGLMTRNAEGRYAITVVTLHPKVRFDRPISRAELDRLHHDAHEACFIANSVKTELRCEPVV
jgi:organic hydroperoxide reductase OsmC/OhrA